MKNKTIETLLRLACKQTDALDAELILANTLGKTREFVVANPDSKISFAKRWKFKRQVKKRKNNFPLAYITGKKEFFGLEFLVNKRVLVPRPETELMVELALTEIREQGSKNNLVIIDVGTGSGCIPIVINKTLTTDNSTTITAITTIATDISKPALKLAKKNAKKHNVNIKFFHGNLLEPILKNSELRTLNSELLITANLPYLTESEIKSEPSIQHEPKQALFAEQEGLAFYYDLLKQIDKIVSCYLCHVSCFMEINPHQVTALSKAIKEQFPHAKISIHQDLSGRDRVVKMVIPKEI